MNDSMKKRSLQEEYIRQHAANIVSFAEFKQERCGRGIILINWPIPDSVQIMSKLAFLEVEKVEELMRQLPIQEEETLADRIIEAVQQYDMAWEAVIVFLDDIGQVADLHIAGFIPEQQPEQLFACSTSNATGH